MWLLVMVKKSSKEIKIKDMVVFFVRCSLFINLFIFFLNYLGLVDIQEVVKSLMFRFKDTRYNLTTLKYPKACSDLDVFDVKCTNISFNITRTTITATCTIEFQLSQILFNDFYNCLPDDKIINFNTDLCTAMIPRTPLDFTSFTNLMTFDFYVTRFFYNRQAFVMIQFVYGDNVSFEFTDSRKA